MDHLDGSMPGKGEAERCPLTFADVPEGHGAGDGQGRRGARGVGHGQRLVAGQQHLGVGGLHPVRVKPVVTQTQPAARHAVGCHRPRLVSRHHPPCILPHELGPPQETPPPGLTAWCWVGETNDS